MNAIIAYVHVLSSVLFLAIMIASFLWIARNNRLRHKELLAHTLKISLIADGILFPLIILIVVTGAFMTKVAHIPPGTPWVNVAYCLFFLVSIIWFTLVLLKIKNLHREIFSSLRLFYGLNILAIMLFFFIIHDALTQQTWFA